MSPRQRQLDARSAGGAAERSRLRMIVPVPVLDRLRRRAVDRRPDRQLGMIARQADLDQRAGRRSNTSCRLPCRRARPTGARPRSRTACPAPAIDLQAVVLLQGAGRCGNAAAARAASPSTASTRPIGVPRWPTVSRSATSLSLCDCTNRRVHGRLNTVCRSASMSRPLLLRQPAVDEAAVIVGRRGDVERAFLAALDLEARHPRRPQRRDVVRQGQVLHAEREALARVALHRRAVAQRQRRPADLVAIAAGIGALAAVAAAAQRLRARTGTARCTSSTAPRG